ncbi:hypothetical protein PCANC_11191 [Puccinia coronata f. sp. avenae]|uniref:Uncharacterized protein n=1 Tax=Puccinia coronata f. sp. avenae TaxID=200324 RepID=A0A2N5V8J3_9BASI|nr:hypothetical protein PCANC_11191 [Puccinia coronata f. sp. avenae]
MPGSTGQQSGRSPRPMAADPSQISVGVPAERPMRSAPKPRPRREPHITRHPDPGPSADPGSGCRLICGSQPTQRVSQSHGYPANQRISDSPTVIQGSTPSIRPIRRPPGLSAPCTMNNPPNAPGYPPVVASGGRPRDRQARICLGTAAGQGGGSVTYNTSAHSGRDTFAESRGRPNLALWPRQSAGCVGADLGAVLPLTLLWLETT